MLVNMVTVEHKIVRKPFGGRLREVASRAGVWRFLGREHMGYGVPTGTIARDTNPFNGFRIIYMLAPILS